MRSLNANFTSVEQSNCPNEAYNLFYQIYKDNFDEAFPEKSIRPNKHYMKQQSWMTLGLLASKRNKNKICNTKLKNPTTQNIDKYKKFINLYNRLKRKMKKNYYYDMIEANKRDIKNTWIILKQAMGKTNNKSNFPNNFMINNELITDPSVIAESFYLIHSSP